VKTAWYVALVAAICFEGLGRKYLPQIPSVAFYLLKDVVLLFGFFRFRPPAYLSRVARHLYRGFTIVWGLGVLWTTIEIFNPEHGSFLLGLIGMRAYWLWWFAPPLVAHMLSNEKQKERAIYVLTGTAALVAFFAALQFAFPGNATLNIYSTVDGEEVQQTIITATGRGRVSSTFSYITGFADFMILIPTLIMSFGLDAREPRLRRIAFIVTSMTAAVVPMSGARSSVLIGGGILVVAAWSAGLFFTTAGRRLLIGGVVAAVLAVVVFPDAFIGVQSRFESAEETNERFVLAAATVVPPLALAKFDYPAFGLGTGMLQNARASMRIPVKMEVEAEVGRYLVELGPFGFLLVWTAKIGLTVALLRAYGLLKRAGRRGAASAALCYAILAMIGNLAFDHIWQALYFMGCGFILAEVISVLRARAALAAASTTTATAPDARPAAVAAMTATP
jgi:hypothetical protein